MKIIVLTKQVKIGDTVKCDFAGIEAAVRIKEHTKADVIVYVLGEKSDGVMQVRDAIAMGCDRGEVIVADDLGELDIWSCARIFAEHVEPKCYDLIISGGFPTDADTVPLGLLTANILGITSISHVENICISEKAGYVDIDRRIEDRLELLNVKLPCLISALSHPEDPIYKTVSGINKAYSKEIPVLDAKGYDNKAIVLDTFKLGERKRGVSLTAISTDEAVSAIIDKITMQHLL
ncbi:MAG: hypothetical protein HFE74_01700 [Firmicutes bacterium]|jgi:electron transfer flavoprotein beta subunit|nr:hypothetical protein [Bacillota bacterium]